MLKIEKLNYHVEGEKGPMDILKDVDLSIADHKFVVVTGPNGGGKTTLAKAIMGLVPATSGKIWWNDTELSGLSITERAKLGISYGFQQPPRFKGITVQDLLDVAAGRHLGHKQSCDLLTQVGLCAKDYIDREVDVSLSGGEVKRIEIATVLAKHSDLMIFDEPEAGIDLWSFARLTETFGEIQAERSATLIIISHQERIMRLADEIVLIADGKIQKQGSRDEILPDILEETNSVCTFLKGGDQQ